MLKLGTEPAFNVVVLYSVSVSFLHNLGVILWASPLPLSILSGTIWYNTPSTSTVKESNRGSFWLLVSVLVLGIELSKVNLKSWLFSKFWISKVVPPV